MLEEKYAPTQPPRVESIKVAGGMISGLIHPSRAELPIRNPWNDMGKGGHWEKGGGRWLENFPENKDSECFVFVWKKI